MVACARNRCNMTERREICSFLKKCLTKKGKKKPVSSYDCTFNIAIIGSSGVGKTSILNRITKHCFTDRYIPTKIDLQEQVVQGDTVAATFRLHDVSNKEEFSLTRRRAIVDADGFIIVFSLADIKSFEELDVFRLHIETLKRARMSELPVIVVGNKSDLGHVEVCHDQIMKWCLNEMDAVYMECSAKDDTEVQRICPVLFDELGVYGSIYEKVLAIQCKEEIGKAKLKKAYSKSSILIS